MFDESFETESILIQAAWLSAIHPVLPYSISLPLFGTTTKSRYQNGPSTSGSIQLGQGPLCAVILVIPVSRRRQPDAAGRLVHVPSVISFPL